MGREEKERHVLYSLSLLGRYSNNQEGNKTFNKLDKTDRFESFMVVASLGGRQSREPGGIRRFVKSTSDASCVYYIHRERLGHI